MISDTDMCQRLNLVRTFGSFVLQEVGGEGDANVISVKAVPKATGVYWIGGTTVAKSGVEIDSVFRVDTNTGGTLLSVFWWISGKWYKHEDDDALVALGLLKEEAFPFDWRFTTPLEEDIFHPT